MSELVPITDELAYSAYERDQAELRLTAEANKVNLMERHSDGMRVIMFHLMKENVTLIFCADERTDSAAEFEVPNAEAMMWYNHAFAHRDADLTPYSQNQNGEGYGA